MGVLSGITSELGPGAIPVPKMPTMPSSPKPPQMPKGPSMPGMPGMPGSGSAPSPDSSLEPAAAIGMARWVNILAILLIITAVTVAITQQVGYGMPPSALGVVERIAMFIGCLAPILNLLRGMRPQHYAIAIFAGIAGGVASGLEYFGRQDGDLVLDPNMIVFGRPLSGWAFIIFAAAILGVGIMLVWVKSWLALDYGLVHHYGPSRTWAFASMIWLGFYVVFTLIQVPVQCGWWCPASPTSSGNPGWELTFSITNDNGVDRSISIPGFVSIMIGVGLISLIIGAVMNHRMTSQKDGPLTTQAVPAT